MNILFIDTEFTDFLDPSLISIGVTSLCGKYEFYAEVSDWNLRGAEPSGFVRAAVLPFLNAPADMVQPFIKVGELITEFIKSINDDVIIAVDYGMDWMLLCDLIEEFPKNMKNRHINIREALYHPKFIKTATAFFNIPGNTPHHALCDARCNRDSWKSLPTSSKVNYLDMYDIRISSLPV